MPSRQASAYCTQAAQAVRRMSAELGAHEQLRGALGVGRARAHALEEPAREAPRCGRGELAHATV